MLYIKIRISHAPFRASSDHAAGDEEKVTDNLRGCSRGLRRNIAKGPPGRPDSLIVSVDDGRIPIEFCVHFGDGVLAPVTAPHKGDVAPHGDHMTQALAHRVNRMRVVG